MILIEVITFSNLNLAYSHKNRHKKYKKTINLPLKFRKGLLFCLDSRVDIKGA